MELRKQDNIGYNHIMDLIPKDMTVLDLACGCGNPFKGIRFKQLVGVDIFKKRFHMPEYDVVIFDNIMNICKLFDKDTFDVITAIDTIEHLEKKEGYKLMEDMEKIARKKVIIFTPLIWSENKENSEDPNCWVYKNPYNYHKSLWTNEDFISKGYSIKPCQNNYVLAEKEI